MKKQLVLAVDEAIPFWQEAFQSLGEVRLFSARQLRSSTVRDVDAFIIRSITQIDSRLLDGSSVRFVGSTSIGMDHVDQEYLDSRGIAFTNAAGSNANAVAEYVTAALLVVAQRRDCTLKDKSLAIIGAGNVGTAVEKKARSLGMSVFFCDPPLRDATGNKLYLSLEEVLNKDFISLHVPLTSSGPHATRHMIQGEVLGRLAGHQFLINSARGSVIQGSELKKTLQKKRIAGAVLDVWEDEPRIDYELLDLVELGTPHIAGYSLDGKVSGTKMVLDALCRHFALASPWPAEAIYPAVQRIRPAAGSRGQGALHSVVVQAYEIERDDAHLRSLSGLAAAEAANTFDRLRIEYALRPEFRHFVVELPPDQDGLAADLEGLGFQVQKVPEKAVTFTR